MKKIFVFLKIDGDSDTLADMHKFTIRVTNNETGAVVLEKLCSHIPGKLAAAILNLSDSPEREAVIKRKANIRVDHINPEDPKFIPGFEVGQTFDSWNQFAAAINEKRHTVFNALRRQERGKFGEVRLAGLIVQDKNHNLTQETVNEYLRNEKIS